jgi:SOS-response transcriptional repressor LexA
MLRNTAVTCQDILSITRKKYLPIIAAMGINERIRERREAAGLTQDDVAKALGVTRSAVAQWEATGGTAPRGKRLKALAAILQTTPEFIVFGIGENLSVNNSNKLQVRTLTLVPIITYRQAAEWPKMKNKFTADESFPCPVPYGPDTYVMRVQGVSMETPHGNSGFSPGHFIFVDPNVEPVNNSSVIVKVDGEDEVMLRQLMIDGSKRYLRALNPTWPNPIIEMQDNATIVGVVILTGRKA